MPKKFEEVIFILWVTEQLEDWNRNMIRDEKVKQSTISFSYIQLQYLQAKLNFWLFHSYGQAVVSVLVWIERILVFFWDCYSEFQPYYSRVASSINQISPFLVCLI